MISKSLIASSLAIGFVAIMASAGQASLITNGDFENPQLSSNHAFGQNALPGTPNNYAYPGYFAPTTVDGWTYNGGAGLIDTSQGANAWYGANSPTGFSGNQYAFVQGTGALSQEFNAATAGQATISWLTGSRPDFGAFNGNQTYEVLLNGNVIYTGSTSSGQNFTLMDATAALLAGSNTLEFLGLAKTDSTVFLDDVSVAAVPEASTWVMMLLGFFAVGFSTCRRRTIAGARLA
jgi:hypothetical protein